MAALVRDTLARQRPRAAKRPWAFRDSVNRPSGERFTTRTGPNEIVRACDAVRGGALAHPSDPSEDRERARRPEWRRHATGPAADDFDRQDEAAGYQRV